MWLPKIVTFLIIILSLPLVNAVVCEAPVSDFPYPGWQMRYNGSVSVGTIIEDGLNSTAGMDDLSVKVQNIFNGTAVNVEIAKEGSYNEGPFSVIKMQDENDFYQYSADMRLLAPYVGASTANLTIYTHDQSILNITTNLTYYSFAKYTFPGEEIELEIELKNIGELGADDISMDLEFGDFEIISSENLPASSLCPNSTFDMKYKIKAPTWIEEDSNYTLYFTLNYNDYNPELGVSKTHTKRTSFKIAVKTLNVDLSKESGGWSLATFGRELTVKNSINNSGNTTAFNLKLIDIPPPDLEVVSGTSSTTISRLEPDKKRDFAYSVVSNDPISCVTMSKLIYKDEFGNQYTTISGRDNISFSPAVRITKKFTDRPVEALAFEYPFKTKSSAQPGIDLKETEIIIIPDISNDDISWTEYGDKNIRIKRSGADITVKVENIGNAMADSVDIYEDLGGVDSTGNTSWQGILLPGASITYGYAIMPIGGENISITTKTSYLDVDRDSLYINEDIVGYFPGVCTKTLTKVTQDLSADFSISLPNLSISQNESISVYQDSKFNFPTTINNNGTERVLDVEVTIDIGNFTLAKGQTKTFFDYLDGDEEINQNLLLWTPSVEEITTYPITTSVKYKDFYGEEYEENITTTITVYPAIEAFIIVRVERTKLSATINYANESNINEPSQMEIKLKNLGFKAIENLTFNLTLPGNLEVVTNDSKWTGRVEAEIKRPTDVLYIFTEDISWDGNLSLGKELSLDLKLSGSKAGFYEIPYTVTYDGQDITGVLDFKIKGAILEITKTIEKHEIKEGEEINILVTVANIGEANATNVIIEDEAPSGVDIIGETIKNMPILAPKQVLVLSYLIKSDKSGDYTLGKAKVDWEDIVGNMYSEESGLISLKVIEGDKSVETIPPPPTPSPTPITGTPTAPITGAPTSSPAVTPFPTPTAFGPEAKKVELNKREVIVTIIFMLIVFGILFRVLGLTRSVEEEKYE